MYSTTIEDIKNSLKKYVDYCKEENILNACNFLAGKFFDSTEEKTYGDVIMNFDGNIISLNQNVTDLFSAQHKEEICKWINDYIEYALLRYDEEFGRTDFGFPFLKPYGKYSMQSIAPLCNYEKIHSSFRGSGLLTSAKPQYFIFVDLYKADDIREEINYHDKFITSNDWNCKKEIVLLQWTLQFQKFQQTYITILLLMLIKSELNLNIRVYQGTLRLKPMTNSFANLIRSIKSP